MSVKNSALKLKGYCESLKDGDSVSIKQIEKLYSMVNELLDLLENEYEENFDSNNTEPPSSPTTYYSDDLPF